MLTQEYVKELFNYNEETGEFVWKVSRKGSKGKGKIAGTLTHKGYMDVCIEGKKYGLHRIAFLWKMGNMPRCVDHINGIKSDNSWKNLRPATYSENGYNYKGTGSSTGYRNVYFDPRGRSKYFVSLVVNGSRKNIGYFMTPEEANNAAIEARKELHGEFAWNPKQIV